MSGHKEGGTYRLLLHVGQVSGLPIRVLHHLTDHALEPDNPSGDVFNPCLLHVVDPSFDCFPHLPDNFRVSVLLKYGQGQLELRQEFLESSMGQFGSAVECDRDLVRYIRPSTLASLFLRGASKEDA